MTTSKYQHAVIPSGARYSFPDQCPCCLGSADGVETISSTTSGGVVKTTVAATIPVCSSCLSHRGVGTREALRIASAGGIALVLGLAVGVMMSPPAGSVLSWAVNALGVLAVVLFVVAYLTYFRVRKRWPSEHPPHANAGCAVGLYAIGGATGFFFHNEAYGRAFREANKGVAEDAPNWAMQLR